MRVRCFWQSECVSTEARVIQQAYRFALDPTAEQERFLSGCAGASRFWFNQGLALVKERLEQRTGGADVDVPWSYKSLCTAFRGDAVKDKLAPWRGDVVTGSYQAGLEALGKALQNFSKARAAGRWVGFPRFRAKGRSHESVIFQRPRITDNRHVMLDRRLGPLRTKESLRKLTRLLATDPNARVMRSTVQRTNRPGSSASPSSARSSNGARAVRTRSSAWTSASSDRRRSRPASGARTPARSRRPCGHCATCSAGSTVSAERTTPTTISRTGASNPAR